MTIKQIKKLIQEADFLPESKKQEWFSVLSTLNENELRQIYDFFTKAKKKQNNYKLKLIYKNNLSKKYIQKVNNISEEFRKLAMKKGKKESASNKEPPENILNKLE
jgi:hypothetical protein